jgi:ribosome-associated translation inhibitor RaiA
MRYCYTEAAKADVTLELSVADLRELAAIVKATADAEGSSYRARRLSDDLVAAQYEVVDSLHRYVTELKKAMREEQNNG